jgi:hypothetical protein
VPDPALPDRFDRLPLTQQLLLGALCALCLLVVSAAPARADSPFSWSPHVNVDNISPIDSVSCSSASLCVTSDSEGNVVTSSNPTGGESAWAPPAWVDDPPEELDGLIDVSCTASPSLLCAAVNQPGKEANVVTSTDPTAGATAWHVESLPGGYSIPWGISCAASSLCVAVSDEEEGGEEHGPIVLSSTNPTGSKSTWKRVLPLYENMPVGNLFGISCPTTSFCVAVGDVGLGGGLFTSNDPTGTASAWSGAHIDEDSLLGVSCASTSLCVTYNGTGTVFTSTEPAGGLSKWKPVEIDGENELTGISCTSSPSTLCVATDAEGNVITSTNPTGGPSAWTVTNVDSGNRLDAVSCASTSLCVAGDGGGNIVVAPFSATPPAGGGGGGGGSGGGGPAPIPAEEKKPLKCKKGFKKKKVHGAIKCEKVKHKKHRR